MEITYISRINAAKRICVDKSTLDRWVNPKSKWHNPDFPKPIKLGRSVLFIQQEIDEYAFKKKL